VAEPDIELSGVARRFAGPPAVTALRDASLRVLRGEYVAVMGRSGSGKSTLLSIIGLLDRPTEGEYVLRGRRVSALSQGECDQLRGRHIGFVFQTAYLLNARSVLDNVRLGLTLAGVRHDARTEMASAALVAVGLEKRLDALASTLSGGERQRVVIARAIAKEPDVLLCDEPTGDLDSATTDEVMDVIDQLRARGTLTIVMITHDNVVARRAERTVRIEDGALVG
jgi:putative ABC transport system ATP-binding protein